MGQVLPFGASEAAVYVDKTWETCRARTALLGAVLRKVELKDGSPGFAIGMCLFTSLDQVEDHLDRVQGDMAG